LAASATNPQRHHSKKALRGLFCARFDRSCLNDGGKMSIKHYPPYGMPMFARLLVLALTLSLAGCDLEAMLADPKVAQREADAKAIGGACRHGLRSIEDCYALNEKASKSAVFAGWKEMDQYMRDNKIEGIEPKGVKQPEVPKVAADEELVDPPKAEKMAADGKKGTKSEPKPEAKPKAKSDTKPS
jgi:outer membrane biosynthesis protein TonB